MRSAWNLENRTVLCWASLAIALWAEPAVAQVSEVVVGVTPSCPYGITACWAGAYEALGRLEGVDSVVMTPDAYNCTATIRLKHDGLPDSEEWASHFKAMADHAYGFRGVEATVVGMARKNDDGLVLRVQGIERPLVLAPLRHKLQWNFKKGAARQPEPDERDAYQQLMPKAADATSRGLKVQVTGPLVKSQTGYVLEVREFIPLTGNAETPSPN